MTDKKYKPFDIDKVNGKLFSIEGFPDYFVCSEGFIVSKYRVTKSGQSKPCRKMKGCNNGNGYLSVLLYNSNGKKKRCYIHRLVAEAFIANPEGKRTVNHKDGDKQNNAEDNLEWATATEQTQHAVEVGLRNTPAQKDLFRKKMSQGANTRAYPLIINGEFYFSLRQAAKNLGYIDHRYLQKDIATGSIKCEYITVEEAIKRGLVAKEESYAERLQ